VSRLLPRWALEGFLSGSGKRDDPAIVALGEAINFQMKIRQKEHRKQATALGTALKEGLKKIPGIQMYSSSAPEISSAVVTFRPGSADAIPFAARQI
jgi:selenocysteine lyase/cysteine desulfurase